MRFTWTERREANITAFDKLPPLYDNIFVQALVEKLVVLETPTAASGGIAKRVSNDLWYYFDQQSAQRPAPCKPPGLKLFSIGHSAIAMFEDGSELLVCRELVNEYYAARELSEREAI